MRPATLRGGQIPLCAHIAIKRTSARDELSISFSIRDRNYLLSIHRDPNVTYRAFRILIKFTAFQEFDRIKLLNATFVRIWRHKGLLINGSLVVILAAAGGVTYLEIRPSSTATPLATTTVAQGTVLATVSSSGTLEAAQNLGLNFTTGGKLTSISVKVGQHVKAGQL